MPLCKCSSNDLMCSEQDPFFSLESPQTIQWFFKEVNLDRY